MAEAGDVYQSPQQNKRDPQSEARLPRNFIQRDRSEHPDRPDKYLTSPTIVVAHGALRAASC
ncbi:hypothetical protein BA177_16415 [Woeseia oceani]|uniref:Uncharacterized protein n=1 Tax=Woeseia oceani TaxID=1548547 RepID=A0A193LJ72_9GAMM|nr:hypothetical protein BA177_16415 [Woeseia oceani]